MQSIIVHRYENNANWQGWIEPEDKSWIVFLDATGRPVLFPHRDPETGAVVDGVSSVSD